MIQRLLQCIGFWLVWPALVWAQTGTIRGTVTDATTGDVLPGVNIVLQELNTGAATDVDGRYVIPNIPPGVYTLEARFVGYQIEQVRVEVQAGEVVVQDFALEPAMLELEEVVVTGTGGLARRREIGNTLEQITATQLERVAISDFGDLIQGKAPGITVMENSGQVGAGATIRLRGNNSLISNDPIIYIDGVRVNLYYPGDPEMNQAASPLNDLNPEDIERVEIVKGAAAATLYGTEAAGGVIQIFTKRGAQGRPVWRLSITQGFHNLGHIGPKEDPKGLWMNDCTEFPGCPEDGDWLRNGHIQDYSLSVQGGSNLLTYFFSSRLNIENGVIDPQRSQMYTIRGNFGFSPSPKLNIRFNSAYTFRRTRWIPDGNNAEGLLLNVMRGPRDYTPDHDDSKVLEMKLFTTNHHFLTGVTVNWTPTPTMLHRVTAGLDFVSQDYQEERPWGFFFRPLGNREAEQYNSRVLTLEYMGSYNRELSGDITSSTSWGGQIFSRSFINVWGFGEDFAGPGDKLVSSGAKTQADEDRVTVASGGFFIQQRFGWRDLVYVTAGLRADGFSTFGEDFGLAYYPKVQLSFVASQLDFWPRRWWDSFRLRAAYGESGRAPGPFDAVRTWDSVSGDEGQPAVTPANIGDPKLGPERSREIELGFESLFLQNRVLIDFTYFFQRTYDALIPVQPIPSLGWINTQLRNVGELENKGVEMRLQLALLQSRNVRWEISGHYSTNLSKVLDLGGLESIYIGWRQYYRVGYPAPAYFHDVVINGDAIGEEPIMEERFIGPSYPTRIFGIGMTLTLWRNLTIDALGEGQGGHVLSSGVAYQNTRRRVWPPCYEVQQKIENGQTADLRTYDWALCDPNFTTYGMWTKPADFFKLRHVTVSYRLPRRFLPPGLRSMRIEFKGRNLLKITDYPGIDPEAFEDGSRSFAAFRQEYYNLPPTRSFTVTLKAEF